MAQAIQNNANAIMIKNNAFILKAEQLQPVIYQNKITPQNIISLINDPSAIHNCSSQFISDAEHYLHQSFHSGDSFIIDFGQHNVGYLSFL